MGAISRAVKFDAQGALTGGTHVLRACSPAEVLGVMVNFCNKLSMRSLFLFLRKSIRWTFLAFWRSHIMSVMN